ncbi:winged helix DNA-binding protein [Mycobacterium sp. WUMAC-067]|uniref:MarR family winged helix-turn-helix transcriptional regulator n=1 Tax=unclassified Mycobacterium TaxID=2642494 RepID=UPI001CD95BF9|nr:MULTISPECIES: MarR family transcriptional regulator [unclassified Mycobacterium]MCA2245081.1 winged helix DNA-binding protein [Mycobacterium sp. WUMAC-067]MCA2314340.1 winged helix DNA-binding protein [Mycobacterium sp. WUMAC-025]
MKYYLEPLSDGEAVAYGVVTDAIRPADDADIVDFLGAVMDVQRMIATLTMPVADEYGISERALGIIFLVHAGLDRPSSLSEYLNVLPSTITADIDKLAAADLLRRTASNVDKRVTRIRVTPRGVRLQKESLRQLHEFFRAKAASVTLRELQACIVTLRKLSGVSESPVPNPLRKTDDA